MDLLSHFFKDSLLERMERDMLNSFSDPRPRRAVTVLISLHNSRFTASSLKIQKINLSAVYLQYCV